MSKFLTNRPYLKLKKKLLFEVKMDERTNVRDHIIKFNKCITDEKDQVIILLASLVESYVTIEIML